MRPRVTAPAFSSLLGVGKGGVRLVAQPGAAPIVFRRQAVRSKFWDDLAEGLRVPRLRRMFQRTLSRLVLPRITVYTAIAPGVAEAGVGEENRLIDRRCRCGRYAAEIDRECAWHTAASAHYTATLLAVLKAAEAAQPGVLYHSARLAADDAQLAAQPWFRDGLRAYAEGRTQKA